MINDNSTNLYLYQFTSGCDQICCSNEYCINSPKFIFTDLSKEDIYKNALKYANEPGSDGNLCPNLPYNITHPSCQSQLGNFRSFVLNFLAKDKINTKETIQQLRLNFLDANIFGLILLSNNLPLSLSNSAIDDELFYDFSTKLSSISHLNSAVLDCVNTISKHLTSEENSDNEKYSKLRSILILFYFPAILHPPCFKTILAPLLNYIEKLSKQATHILIHWLSHLPRLFIQIIGAVHFAISMYFCTRKFPNIHSDEIKQYLKIISILYDVNSFLENPLPPSVFYNHHINEEIDYEHELDLNRNHLQSVLRYPYVLSIKTKAAICHLESEQYMGIYAYRSLLMNVFGNQNSDLFLTLRIRRDHLIDDAVAQLSNQNSCNFLKKLRVIFEGESAVDVGGPSREFLYLVSEQLFSPDHGMFITVNDNKYHWFSQYTFEEDRSFFLVGAVVGLAIHSSVVLPIRFPQIVYKRIMRPSQPLTINDLKEVDPQLAKSLLSISNMAKNGEDVSVLMLNFTAQIDCFGESVCVPLVEGMEDVEVVNENVDFYISSYINFILVKNIENHFEAFRRGFELACRLPSYKLLDPAEIDLLVSGEGELDWGALQRSAVYKDGYSAKSRAVKWFWEIFHGFTKEQKLMFLKFATGTDRAPIGGLGNLKLVIQRGADDNRLPVSHTCFNVFTLPDYRTKKQMTDNVLLAIQHTEGFGFV